MKKRNAIPVLLLALLLGACSRTPGMEGFTYRYSVESAGNYKVELQLNPDSTYVIGYHNYFFDRFEGKRQPLYHSGKLSGEEYRVFRELIGKSRLGKMKDSYGFGQPGPDAGIIVIVGLEQGNRTKYVSFSGGGNRKFPPAFKRLIRHSAQFIDDKNHD